MGVCATAAEDVGESRASPLDRTCLGWKFKLSRAHTFAEPSEEQLFVSLDQRWLAADAKKRHQRLVRFKLAIEPVGPLRDTGKAVNVRQGRPHKQWTQIG